jgi:hypothetical protein
MDQATVGGKSRLHRCFKILKTRKDDGKEYPKLMAPWYGSSRQNSIKMQ